MGDNLHSKNIYFALQDAISRKAARDNKKITAYQLAKAIGIPHSILVKILHHDPKKRVKNPQISTLTKIIDYFQADGFNLSIDGILSGNTIEDVSVANIQKLSQRTIKKNLIVINQNDETIGDMDIYVNSTHSNIFAILIEDQDFLFQSGSIFIVDRDIKLSNGTLVAIRLQGKIYIKKLHIADECKQLVEFNNENSTIILDKTEHQILGIVIQINANT
jgi:transcriptional regulator with XRE-family HTH domain